jgi:hypothetical protein
MVETSRVLWFSRAGQSSHDWTQQELAEFYRVENALLQGGLSVVTDRGLSDEGDPWFVFCRSESEEVIAHFARIDGHYFVVSSAFSGVARGRDFKFLIRELMEAHPLMLPRNRGNGQNVFVHPAALLAALLAASYLISSDKDAAVQDVSATGPEEESGFWLHFRNHFAVLSAVAIAATWIENRVESTFDFAQNITLDTEQGANLPADLTSHAIDVAFDAAAQALRDADIASHRVAGDPAQAFALEARSDANEGIFPAPSTLLKAPSQSTVASAPETNPMAAFNIDGVAASHADSTKASYSVALNDADALLTPTQPGQVLLDPGIALDRHPLGSSATPTPTNLGSGSTIPTAALPAATNNQENPSLPVVAFTLPQSSSEIQNNSMLALSTSDAASTNASTQVSTSTSTQVSTSTSTQVSTSTSVQISLSTSVHVSTGTSVQVSMHASAHEVASISSGVQPATYGAPACEGSLLAFSEHSNLKVAEITMEPAHTLVGIIPHVGGLHS